MEFDYTTLILAIIVFSLMLMVIGLRFEVRNLREEINRIADTPRFHRPASYGSGDTNPNLSPSPARSGDGDEMLRALVAKGRKIEAIKEAR